MNRILLPLALLLIMFGMFACGPSANKKLVVNIDGACESCPVSRLDSLLKDNEAYVSHTYDAKTGVLTVEIDSTITPSRKFLDILTSNGYEVDSKEFGILTTVEKASDLCCVDDITVDIDDEDSSLNDELEEESDLSLDVDQDLEDMDLDKVSGKELKNENLLDEDDVNITEDDEVDDKDFKSSKKKKK